MTTNLYTLIQQRAAAHPHATAVGGQQGLTWKTLTSRQLVQNVDGLACELANQFGIASGDRVILWVPNHWRTPIYLFALWKLGAVVVPFDREMNPEAASSILKSVKPRAVIAGYGERPTWADGWQLSEWGEGEWSAGDAATPDATVHSSHQTAVDRADGQSGPEANLAAIFFTSGTTGNPKGCMISHANLLAQIEALQHTIVMSAESRLASILPLSHLFELTCGLLYPLARGAAIHYIPSRRGPDIIRVLSEQKITHMIAVPQLLGMMGATLEEQLSRRLPAPAYRALVGLAERLPLAARRRLFWPIHRKLGGHLRLFAAGGAALPPETHRLWERFGVRVCQGYGASECSPVIACGNEDGSTPIGSVGQPLQGVNLRLSTEGELLVKGPNVMRGYWQDPARTAEVLNDGWYATGDLARIDEQGHLWLLGRAKDLIVLPSGMNVWPQDIEEALRGHPAVKDASVLMVAGAAGGASLHAYLIPATAAAQATDLGLIVGFANGRLAQHQRVATASWWPESDFPRTSTMKVRRNKLPLPSAVASVTIDSVLAADDPVGQAIAGAARVAAVQPRQTLGELGLDSLGLVDLALALEEKTGKAVGDGDLKLDMSVDEVRSFLSKAPALSENGGGGARPGSEQQPAWPYTWGRAFRFLSAPIDVLYRLTVTRTIVLGGQHLTNLPDRVIMAGTHHSFADLPLLRHGLYQTPARAFGHRLLVAAWAGGLSGLGILGVYARLAFGLYPLQQHGDRDASLRRLVQLADAGNAVVIFPQGVHAEPALERAGDPAANFKPGVAHITEALTATVVPFGVAGTERLIPAHPEDHRGLVIAGIPVRLNRGPLAIAFGEPLTMEPEESPSAFAGRLQVACFALTRQAEAALTGGADSHH